MMGGVLQQQLVLVMVDVAVGLASVVLVVVGAVMGALVLLVLLVVPLRFAPHLLVHVRGARYRRRRRRGRPEGRGRQHALRGGTQMDLLLLLLLLLHQVRLLDVVSRDEW